MAFVHCGQETLGRIGNRPDSRDQAQLKNVLSVAYADGVLQSQAKSIIWPFHWIRKTDAGRFGRGEEAAFWHPVPKRNNVLKIRKSLPRGSAFDRIDIRDFALDRSRRIEGISRQKRQKLSPLAIEIGSKRRIPRINVAPFTDLPPVSDKSVSLQLDQMIPSVIKEPAADDVWV